MFAEKGSHGSTTRELAQAAGVSEALLFKHFPNKEALYSAMIQACIQERDHELIERLMALKPGRHADYPCPSDGVAFCRRAEAGAG